MVGAKVGLGVKLGLEVEGVKVGYREIVGLEVVGANEGAGLLLRTEGRDVVTLGLGGNVLDLDGVDAVMIVRTKGCSIEYHDGGCMAIVVYYL